VCCECTKTFFPPSRGRLNGGVRAASSIGRRIGQKGSWPACRNLAQVRSLNGDVDEFRVAPPRREASPGRGLIRSVVGCSPGALQESDAIFSRQAPDPSGLPRHTCKKIMLRWFAPHRGDRRQPDAGLEKGR
jgi:hypothetical protein